MALAADPGAAPLHPSTLSSHVQRATCNLQPLIPSRLSPHASRRSPLPKPLRTGGVPRRGHTHQCGRTCRCTRRGSTAQRRSYWAHTPVRAHMSVHPSTLSSDVQRATCNLQPLIPSRLTPLASRLTPLASPQTLEDGRSPPARAHTPVRAHMSVHPSTLSSDVQRATCNLQPLIPSRLSPLAARLSPNP